MNQNGTTPRDRLDPRLFEQPAASAAVPSRNAAPACACGGDSTTRSGASPRMDPCGQSACAPDAGMQMPSLAMVYSPRQSWQGIYCEEDALLRGTIFEELDKPFYGPACMGGGCNG